MIAESTKELLKQLEDLCKARNLSKRKMAKELDIPLETFRKWFGGRKKEPSSKYLGKIKDFIASSPKIEGAEPLSLQIPLSEAKERVERIKYLLLLLESELRYFRDGQKEARDVFRTTLDQNDIGYISSLLGMLGEEDKFERWRTLTTNKFRFFGEKKGVR